MEGKGGEGEGEGIDRRKKKIFQLFKTNRLTGLLYMCVCLLQIRMGTLGGWRRRKEGRR
ncbi:unnamed protein product [Meloidogyne enterolobii]|uniref:Uncharacterized protein n=1 Tax=Meloidogyne enterolobii TaxID=390850 RepID=A0ACB0Y136_MELEN